MAHILIVEDDPVVNDLLAFIMEQDNYTLTRALDGKAALGLAQQVRPDLILMDLRLPTIDGSDAIRILKSNPETRGIPIIAVSASSTLRAEAADLPVDAVISKPFDVDSLLAEVTVQLQRSAACEAAPIPVRLGR
jgi:DNA-binding response OmpR family regulator